MFWVGEEYPMSQLVSLESLKQNNKDNNNTPIKQKRTKMRVQDGSKQCHHNPKLVLQSGCLHLHAKPTLWYFFLLKTS